MVLTSMDSQYTVMTALVMTGLLTTIRYDTGEVFIANLISLAAGFVFFVIEHTHSTETEQSLSVGFQQRKNRDHLHTCDDSTAALGLLTGGGWFVLPFITTMRYVYTGNNRTSTSMFTTIMICFLPLQLQIFRPDKAWIPFLFPETHVNMLKGNMDDSVGNYYIIVTVMQNILLTVSCAVNMWQLLACNIYIAPKPKSKKGDVVATCKQYTKETEFFVVSLFLVLIWASFMTNFQFEQVHWIYLVALDVSLVCIPDFKAYTI